MTVSVWGGSFKCISLTLHHADLGSIFVFGFLYFALKTGCLNQVDGINNVQHYVTNKMNHLLTGLKNVVAMYCYWELICLHFIFYFLFYLFLVIG